MGGISNIPISECKSIPYHVLYDVGPTLADSGGACFLIAEWGRGVELLFDS